MLWSKTVDDAIADMVHGVPPFPWVRESLQKMQVTVDLMVVSATPVEALEREWGEHGIAQYMTKIAGQEMGTKKQHLQFAAKGKYPDDHILLIGDAPGDRDSAKGVDVLYYPINPGFEDKSWKLFYDEALGKFLIVKQRRHFTVGKLVDLTAKPNYLSAEQIQWLEDTIAGMTDEDTH